MGSSNNKQIDSDFDEEEEESEYDEYDEDDENSGEEEEDDDYLINDPIDSILKSYPYLSLD